MTRREGAVSSQRACVASGSADPPCGSPCQRGFGWQKPRLPATTPCRPHARVTVTSAPKSQCLILRLGTEHTSDLAVEVAQFGPSDRVHGAACGVAERGIRGNFLATLSWSTALRLGG